MQNDGAIDDEEFILLYLRANYPVLTFPHEFLTLSPRPVIFRACFAVKREYLSQFIQSITNLLPAVVVLSFVFDA